MLTCKGYYICICIALLNRSLIPSSPVIASNTIEHDCSLRNGSRLLQLYRLMFQLASWSMPGHLQHERKIAELKIILIYRVCVWQRDWKRERGQFFFTLSPLHYSNSVKGLDSRAGQKIFIKTVFHQKMSCSKNWHFSQNCINFGKNIF